MSAIEAAWQALLEEAERAASLCDMLAKEARHDRRVSPDEIANIAGSAAAALRAIAAALPAPPSGPKAENERCCCVIDFDGNVTDWCVAHAQARDAAVQAAAGDEAAQEEADKE